MSKIQTALILPIFIWIFPAITLAQRQSPNSIRCENWSPLEWDNFLDKNIFWSREFPNYFYKDLVTLKDKCAANLGKAGLAPCLDRISGYFEQFKYGDGQMFTGRMSDHDYLASQPQDVMALPPELDHSKLPENWREIAKKNGWKYVLFHSYTGPSGRLVFYIPGEKYDRFILYAVMAGSSSPSKDPTTYDYLQMQAVEKQVDGSPKLPKYYFRTWKFTGEHQAPEVGASGGRCVSCHISGPRAIEPQKSEFTTELGGVNNLEQFNNLVVRKAPLDYTPYYDPKYFPSHLKVGEGTCTGCHNGKDRQSLAFSVDKHGSFDDINVYRKVFIERTMPMFDDQGLTDAQRRKMVDLIEDEYYDKVKKWLTETKCASLSAKTPGTQSQQPSH